MKAFSLLESIVTILVLTIVAVSLTHILMEGFRVWWVNKDLIDMRQDARAMLNRITLEFSEAYSGNLVSSSNFSFTADVDSDGDLDTVRYYLDAGSVKRQVDGAPASGNIICGSVSSLTFSFNSPVLTVDAALTQQGNTIKARASTEGRCI